ncbi:MAG: TIGR04255 family protein [Candidatus Nanopelagicales bacterium]|nr:TIGR04255 family protein [Candidatus Nanopelagicales bacterium]MDZ4249635.1 TIGR04255 family protein [Candidatus Nanopelagicales bacterium]
MYPGREVFANTPLALVAAEVRFTDSARLRQQTTLDAIAIALEDRFPFARPSQQPQAGLRIAVGAASPPPPSDRLVLTDETSTQSVSLTPTSLTYETTAYDEFPYLLGAVEKACQALVDAGVRPAISRIGLRYIDEVRVPVAITDARQWGEWISQRLVDSLSVGPEGSPAVTFQGVATYDLGDGKGLNFRFAALDQSPVVAPLVLHRPHPAGLGPFFVLDCDGYQNFDGQVAIPLEPGVVGRNLSAVHEPAGTAFQKSITDKARELFRGDRP